MAGLSNRAFVKSCSLKSEDAQCNSRNEERWRSDFLRSGIEFILILGMTMRFQRVRMKSVQLQQEKNNRDKTIFAVSYSWEIFFSSLLLWGVSTLKAANMFKAQATHSSLHCGIMISTWGRSIASSSYPMHKLRSSCVPGIFTRHEMLKQFTFVAVK
jgi:hypothetical protein